MKPRIQYAIADLVPMMPQTPQMDLTGLRNQRDVQTDTDTHMNRCQNSIYKDEGFQFYAKLSKKNNAKSIMD